MSHNISRAKKLKNPKKKNIAGIDETPMGWGGGEHLYSCKYKEKK